MTLNKNPPDLRFNCGDCGARRQLQAPSSGVIGSRYQTYMNCPLCNSCNLVLVDASAIPLGEVEWPDVLEVP
jgi:transcription elongation factor Elf1